MTTREIAMNLLSESGCELDCYRNQLDWAIKDINTLIEEGKTFEFSAEEIAQALVDISNEQPEKVVKHKKYCMVYDMGHTIDGVEFDDYEEAKADMIHTYLLWEAEEISDKKWKFSEDGTPLPTEKQIEDWDYMIDNCCCYVVEWNDTLEEYNDSYYADSLSDEELKKIGWMYFNELMEREGKNND